MPQSLTYASCLLRRFANRQTKEASLMELPGKRGGCTPYVTYIDRSRACMSLKHGVVHTLFRIIHSLSPPLLSHRPGVCCPKCPSECGPFPSSSSSSSDLSLCVSECSCVAKEHKGARKGRPDVVQGVCVCVCVCVFMLIGLLSPSASQRSPMFVSVAYL